MFMEVIIYVILLVVGIAIVLMIHVCVVGRAFRGDPANGTASTPVQAVRFPSMKDEDVKELPCFEYNLESGNGECAVCLENFRAGEKCRILPKCSHSFHADCIDSWLLKSAGACPVCRTGVKSPELEQTSSSFSDAQLELS